MKEKSSSERKNLFLQKEKILVKEKNLSSKKYKRIFLFKEN